MTNAYLAAPVSDPYGYIALPLIPSGHGLAMRRRQNVVETLDGGVAINDFGYHDAGHSLTLNWIASPRRDDVVAYLVRFYSQLILSHPTGCYDCAPAHFKPSARSNSSRLELTIIARLSPSS